MRPRAATEAGSLSTSESDGLEQEQTVQETRSGSTTRRAVQLEFLSSSSTDSLALWSGNMVSTTLTAALDRVLRRARGRANAGTGILGAE